MEKSTELQSGVFWGAKVVQCRGAGAPALEGDRTRRDIAQDLEIDVTTLARRLGQE